MRSLIRALLFAMLFVIACTDPKQKPADVSKEIEGTYTFKYPSGQVEVLIIKHDSTFDQEIYSSNRDFVKKAIPLYDNQGTWSITGIELEFNHWLMYCYALVPDSILAEPKISHISNVLWLAPTEKHKARIDIYSENGYVLTKR